MPLKLAINYERADGTGIQGLQIPTASSAKAGVMAAADKVKLDTTLPNKSQMRLQQELRLLMLCKENWLMILLKR